MKATDLHTTDLRWALDTVRAFVWQESSHVGDAEAGLRMLRRYVDLRTRQLTAGRAARPGSPVRLFQEGA